MIINVRYTPAAWLVDENTANLVPEFRELLADERFGAKALAFVALTKDPTSFLATTFEDEDVRQEQAFISVFDKGDSKKFAKLKPVAAAMEKYEQICDIPSITMRREYRESVKNMSKFLKEKGESLTLENFNEYMTALSKMPAQIVSFDSMAKGDIEDIELAKKIVRGGRELSYLEKKSSERNKKRR